MKKKLLTPLFLSTFILLSLAVKAQPQFSCNGDFLFTRQFTPSPNTYISKVNFGTGTVAITNPGTIAPASNTNASVQYNGYIWTQDWPTTASFALLKVAADYSYTKHNISGIPANTNFNNAGVDKNGLMYILQNANNPVTLYTIDLSSGTPTTATSKTVTGLPSSSDGVTWGDISIDPTTNRVYCWYHPSPAPATNLVGLYEITNITSANPVLVKVGIAQQYTMGSLFFNDRGQLFGYGSAILNTSQDRIFAIDKATGLVTQYGIPDISVTQSDGCECAFRISLDRATSVPVVNLPKCSVDTFNYIFTPRNYTTLPISGITFSDTLDTKLSYAFSASTLQTQLQAYYGAGVAVSLTSYGGGTNNVVNISGMNIPIGSNSFNLAVKVDANLFTTSTSITEQAYLNGISVILGGPHEPSNNPTTFNPKDATPITINLNGSRCLPPIADNFINTPMPQGNAATVIPGLSAADPDGTIVSYKILTLPAATEGVLSIACPATPAGASCNSGFANLTAAVLTANPGGIVLTPAQAATMRFDPVSNYTGTTAFTFNATDNSGNISNTATYKLPVTAQPPISNNIMENSMPNTNAATAIQGLNSSDVDGTISSYQLTSLPTTAQGVLSVPCPPNLTNASACSGGYQNLLAATLTAYPSGIPLTATQMANMHFDPAAGFVGNATFNYNATDNSGLISNTANYTIPVTATTTLARPPLADNINAQPLNNSLGATTIPPLKATDIDGTVTSYTLTAVPTAVQGTLSVPCPVTGVTCVGGFADITPAVLTANGGTLVLTPAQASALRFDPVATFTGTATFGYFATDNTTLVSNPATYTIPVINIPPTAVNINTTVPFNSAVTAIVPLSGSDADGTVTGYSITTLPTTAQGVLSVQCPPNITGASACTGGFQNLLAATLTANPSGIPLTPAQAATIRFLPATGFSGTVPFTYTSTDNNSNISTTANYNITITNMPPVASDITAPVIANTAGATTLTALSATDPDGTIASYTINSLPPAASGVLSLSGVAVTVGQVLTPAQISLLKFDPVANYTGVVTFTYTAIDNSGNLSNTANYNIPISGVGNLPPIAKNIFAPAMPNSNAATAIPALVGSDPDGTVASYTITSLPPASKGILSLSGVAVTVGQVLTPAQISSLQFDPTAGFSGYATFTYFDTDNNGEVSNTAAYTIPVTGTPPVATPIVAPAMPLTNGPTTIPALIATDADGSIANYTIDILPPVSQGTLSIPCGPTPTGATCAGGFADLTSAVLTANPNGIMLTATQMAGMRFAPSGTYTGNVVFNYHATDNSGLLSNSTNYTIPVTGVPPVSIDILSQKIINTNGPTVIPALSSSDVDGTISSYNITSIPPTAQGVLSIPCGPTPASATCTGGFADLTAAVLAANPGGISLTATQMAGMRFAPVITYSGTVLFNYAAYDNSGNLSNVATYIIPVITPAAALPVQQLDVNAILHNYTATINWQTQNEINTSRFYVERSIDNSNFITVGNLPGAGTYSGTKNYSLPDDVSALAGNALIYYRIKEVDINGKITYSSTVVVRLSTITGIKTWPNPVKDNVIISLYSQFNTDINVRILDVTGKTMHLSNYNITKGNNQLSVNDLSKIAKGLYMIQVNDKAGNIQFIQKITKD